MIKIDFVIPVCNEDKIFRMNAELILNFLKNADFDFDWHLVFVVNGSTADFEEMVKIFSEKNAACASFYVLKEGGKGRTIKKYFNDSIADALVYMDMDLAVSLDNIHDLVRPILQGQADLCFGSRMLPGSSRKRSRLRELNSKVCIFLSQIILDHDFSDLQCGFKAMTKKSWDRVSEKIKNNNWFFDTELVYYAKKTGCRIIEIPIDWSENRYDDRQSKVRVFQDGMVFLKEMIRLRWEN